MPKHGCDQLPGKTPDPCTLIIFGGSGDLTSRKLIPALYSLFTQNQLPNPFTIVGCGRTELSDDQYRAKLKTRFQDSGLDLSQWDEFASFLHYFPVTYDPSSGARTALRLPGLFLLPFWKNANNAALRINSCIATRPAPGDRKQLQTGCAC